VAASDVLLRPWLAQLVVVGGWAHRLHRFHRLAKPPNHLPFCTRDTDLAFLPDQGSRMIYARR
jgi:hypothetical protein